MLKKLVKSIYKILPFKKAFFVALRGVWSPPHRVYQHLHFQGKINVKTTGNQEFKMHHYGFELENELFWRGIKGGWEQQSIQLWEKLCTVNDCIIDVGANTGVYALIAKTVRPTAQVVAFEPVKRVFEKLQENIALNQFDVKAYELALSDSDGKATIYDQDTEHTYSVTVSQDLSPEGVDTVATSIDIIRFDTFIAQHQLPKVGLMKIDVETHEPEVLEGMGEYLDTMRPTLLIEILTNEVAQRVEKLVEGKGYLYFDLDEKNPPRKVDRIQKSGFYNYLICTESIAQQLQLI
ncbi:FkbM family methyltransferase [Microscilla marina]|uniref:Methyltransferase, FkbM family protein n=1 Tax=Microscilla marina ATCC 23134 TaxID=313606 RepID=A1ZHR8_MICM2|nr:FkbM family methyltransferase [Microscilla marina]EAY30075.1 methyltransferase, FkbM family protein [Microscilla marina ATCC 23134]